MAQQNLLRDRSGQAMTEYVVLLAVLVSVFVGVHQLLKQSGFGAKLLDPVREDFAATYQYGHPQARFNGQDFDGAKLHPRITSPGNFRIFINPRY